jgi:osmotically-inducible protein OsmY
MSYPLRLDHPTRRGLHKLAFSLLLAVLLPGCAAYQKCGFGNCPGDAHITEEVRALFDRHPVLEPPNLLNIRTVDGVVYLTGLVDTDLERQIAESVAHEAPGVVMVVNSIGLSGSR